jgi:hypothetical protein
MSPRVFLAVVLALLVVGAPSFVNAEPLGPTTVSDPDDTGRRLDIRSATIETLESGRTRVVLVFWNRVPAWFLRHRAAGVAPNPHYFVRFWPTRTGWLRVTWGDSASSCCLSHPARHPDPFTYLTHLPLDQVEPPPTSMHGYSTKKLDCGRGSRCGAGARPAPLVDRTPARAL